MNSAVDSVSRCDGKGFHHHLDSIGDEHLRQQQRVAAVGLEPVEEDENLHELFEPLCGVTR